MKNKLIALLMVIATLLTFTACGGSNLTPSEGLEYQLNDDGVSCSVTGIGSCTDTKIVIAGSYEGLPVTEIADDAFSSCTEITDVVIPDGVTRIGVSAFSYCTNLTTITVPRSVTEIEAGTCRDCPNLTTIEYLGTGAEWDSISKSLRTEMYAYLVHSIDEK